MCPHSRSPPWNPVFHTLKCAQSLGLGVSSPPPPLFLIPRSVSQFLGIYSLAGTWPPGKSACHIFGGNKKSRTFRAKFIWALVPSLTQGP